MGATANHIVSQHFRILLLLDKTYAGSQVDIVMTILLDVYSYCSCKMSSRLLENETSYVCVLFATNLFVSDPLSS